MLLKSMKKTILEIYALAVCFIIIICFAVTLGMAIHDVIQIKYPSFTLNAWQYEKFQSNENFCSNKLVTGVKNQCPSQNENELTKMREAAYATSLKNEQRNGLQGLVNALIIILINIIIFIPHWIIARRARA